ncbi:hypothetical protein [Bacillus sp. REN16]|uniref:hypothetical protein n=1 Tax=Bacillus sp. REN16 TaxID=2887296 RepID=UPI001E5CD6E4|nr:hypothetical protein [Bacillus sp. REN16]MCC3359106.1 hypothetical protein [Bacillus sp. REN16]
MKFNNIEDEITEESWLSFYLNIGRHFYEANLDERNKITLCLSVPFLHYIAAGIGLGICDKLYSLDISKNEGDILKELNPGTLIFYQAPNTKKEKAYTFEGFNVDGYPLLLSKGKNPETITLTRTQLWRNIRVAPDQVKYKRNRIIKTSYLQTPIYSFYNKANIDNILRKSQINILFIGNEKRLKKEMRYEFEKGYPLSQWLLPKSMFGAQSSFVSEIVSSGTRVDSIDISPETFLIFDGVQAFTQSWYRKMGNPSIILLERTASMESLFSGIDLLNRIIDSRDVSVASDFLDVVASIPKAPGNLELTAWRGGE